MRRHTLKAVLFFFTAFSLSAQIESLTIDQSVDLALKHNLDVRQAEQDVLIARADLGAAWVDLYMPSLFLSGSFGYTDPVTASNPFNDSYSAGVTVRKDLFSGGKYWFAKEARRFALAYAEARLADKKREVERTARVNFYALLLLKEKLRIAVESDKNLKYRLESARLNFANGVISQLDYLKEQVRYKNNQPLLLKTQNEYTMARLSFTAFLGLETGRNSAEGPEPTGDILDSLGVTLSTRDEAKLTAAALDRDLSLLALDYEAAVNDAARNALLTARWPTLSGSFNFRFDYKSSGGADRALTPGWIANLALNIPLDPWLPGISRLSRQIESADALAVKQKLKRAQTVIAVRTRIKTLLANLAIAEESLASQKENVRQAKLVQEAAAKQYREGSLSVLDLNDAETAYGQALANYWQALYDRYANVLRLNDYLPPDGAEKETNE
ncbi:MAG: TolC family protein [Spirochaetales bacterium]|nr:TolC family protein [Spirochaetales bacterium]